MMTTEQELLHHHLYGLALAADAFRLGFAPVRTWRLDDERGFATEEDARNRAWILWEPQTNLAQAEACFRQVRAWGWRTRCSGGASEGEAYAEKRLARDRYIQQRAQWPTAVPTEAQALLLCAVLVAHAEEESP